VLRGTFVVVVPRGYYVGGICYGWWTLGQRRCCGIGVVGINKVCLD
jgi:hypothetical protein